MRILPGLVELDLHRAFKAHNAAALLLFGGAERQIDTAHQVVAVLGVAWRMRQTHRDADLHGLLIAPHGVFDGLLGLAALVQVCATLPDNYIAFEYPSASDPWWTDIVEGLPKQIVKDSMVDLLEAPGLGLDINAEAAKRYLKEGDEGFFDK